MTTLADPHRNPSGATRARVASGGVAPPLLKGSAAVRQREAHAVDLRAEGLTYAEIGARLGSAGRWRPGSSAAAFAHCPGRAPPS